jgi:sulfoquinovosyltransferase
VLYTAPKRSWRAPPRLPHVLRSRPHHHTLQISTFPQVVNVLGFKLPFYKSATLLLSVGLSVRVMWYLWRQRPDVIHVSTPGILCFAAVLYARLLAVPLVMSYHTHIPEYIPRYTWSGLVAPMWSIIRWCTRRADLTLVTSKAMKVGRG